MKVVCKGKKKVIRNLCNLFIPRTLSMVAYTEELQTENMKLYSTVIVIETERVGYNGTNVMDLL